MSDTDAFACPPSAASRPTDVHRKRNLDVKGWIQLGIGILIFAGTCAGVWAAVEVKHATAMTRIGNLETNGQRLQAVPEALAEIRAEQKAQAAALLRLERGLEQLAARPR